jgi:hypothetical protein
MSQNATTKRKESSMQLTHEQIEWGKQNKTAWGWLTEEQKKIFLGVNIECLRRLYCTGDGEAWVTKGIDFSFGDIYRISPDYQPEPEVVKCEVFLDGDTYCYRPPEQYAFNTTIISAPSKKNFICFEFTDGIVSMNYRICQFAKTEPAEVAKYVVFAK